MRPPANGPLGLFAGFRFGGNGLDRDVFLLGKAAVHPERVDVQADTQQREDRGHVSRLATALFAPVEIAPLVYFRFVFGALMCWEVIRYFQTGWINAYYIQPQFFFTYLGFGWIIPWPGGMMYVHFAVLGLLAACITLGFFYRIATVLFFLGFTYVFLLDQANYLNHFYLISLVSLLLIVLPAHRAVSLDVGRNPGLHAATVPAWTLWLLRFQLGVAYFYGGLAKLNFDWLSGEPMRTWLAQRQDFPLFGHLFTQEWAVYAMCYGGMLFDLLIVPMLLWRRTRLLGVAWMIAFHVINSQLFNIGIFPWLMLLATPVFFPPDWWRAMMKRFGVLVSPPAPRRAVGPSLAHRGLVALMGVFVLFQLLFPFRHFLYPGNPSWTEEGHLFAWHMKLRDKESTAKFIVADPKSGESWNVDPRRYLTPRQYRKMSSRPDMILQFAHFLEDCWRERGYDDVEVRADVNASLNGRRSQPLVDATVDLSEQSRTLSPWPWIVPLREPLPSPPPIWQVSRSADEPS